MNSDLRSSRGFTLLEVLVALAIIAIAMGALIKTSGGQTANASYLKEKTLAHWVGMNQLVEQRITRGWPDIGNHQGSTEMARKEWYWTLEVKKTPDPNSRQLSYAVYSDEAREHMLTRVIGYINKT